jgi:hypothetical protein
VECDREEGAKEGGEGVKKKGRGGVAVAYSGRPLV